MFILCVSLGLLDAITKILADNRQIERNFKLKKEHYIPARKNWSDSFFNIFYTGDKK